MGFSLQTEELCDGIFVQPGADDTEASHHIGSAEADILLAGDEVEVDPLAVCARHDALGAQDDAVLAGIQLLQNGADLLGGVLLCGLAAPGGEDLVGVVVMMVMVVVMAAAGALLAVVMVVVLVVMVMTAAALLTMLVVVLMVVTAAAVLVVVMVLVMMVAALLGIMAVVVFVAALVVMVVTAAALLTVLVMVMMLVLGLLHVLFQGVLALEGGDELLAA